jgi:hypothetical protein
VQLQNFYAQDVNGNIVPGAVCSLFLPGTTTLATGLTDVNGSSLTNPFSADANGLAQLAAPDGKYDLKIEAGLIVSTLPVTFADVIVALDQLNGFLGPSATEPTTRADGSALRIGDRYIKTPEDVEYIYSSTGWRANNLDGSLLASPIGASLVGFQYDAPGSVPQTVADLSYVAVNVRWFGITGDGVTDQTAAWQAAITAAAGKILDIPDGLYIKSDVTRLPAKIHMRLAPGATIRMVGTAQAWMFVNGEIGNTTYATGYDGDGGIKVTGGTMDMNGFSGRSRAAFVIGHSRDVTFEGVTFMRGWESHNVEINSSYNAKFLHCTFKDQGFDGASSYECVNVDYASAAGFPGFGAWDLTPDRNLEFFNCTFERVHSAIAAHSVPTGSEVHVNIRMRDITLEDIATRGIRMQGFDDSFVDGLWAKNVGNEAITILTGNRNRLKNIIIHGASTALNGQYSAIRIDGNNNTVDQLWIDDGGYANKYAYAIGVAAGSRNSINTKDCAAGVSGLVTNAGTLTEINGHTLLFSGAAGGAGTVITLADSLNNYEIIEVCTGAVGGGLFQTAVSRPFSPRNWAVGTDSVAVTTASGRFVAQVTALTSLTITSSSDSARQIYGVRM